jgi:hypothetical protein
VRGGIAVNDGLFCMALAELGLGLAYVFEPLAKDAIRAGRLRQVLEAYAPTVPGLFLYYPSRAQSSPPLRSFIETLRELPALSPPRARPARVEPLIVERGSFSRPQSGCGATREMKFRSNPMAIASWKSPPRYRSYRNESPKQSHVSRMLGAT